MAATKFFASTIDGSTVTRSSKTRHYTHCIVNGSQAVTWCGSYELAQKQLAKYLNTPAAIVCGVQFAIAEAHQA
jgi:hypothetical protein